MSNKINRKRWTLVEHLRGLGIEPEAPFHPAWEDAGNQWGHDFKTQKTLTSAMLEKINSMQLPAAPIAVTLYRWARTEGIELEPFKGSVNADPRVREAMASYMQARVEKEGFFVSMENYIDLLLAQGPLPKGLAEQLNAHFNTANWGPSMRAWLAAVTGVLPAIDTWKEMRLEIVSSHDIGHLDVQINGSAHRNIDHHWSKHHRMELVLAAWLEGDSKYLAMPLYNHLPNISMETPDTVTAIFWLVASQRIDMDPHGQESKMLAQWMAQYPEYLAFVTEKRGILENLMCDDAVVCGKALHQFWCERHTATPDQPSLDGIMEP